MLEIPKQGNGSAKEYSLIKGIASAHSLQLRSSRFTVHHTGHQIIRTFKRSKQGMVTVTKSINWETQIKEGLLRESWQVLVSHIDPRCRGS